MRFSLYVQKMLEQELCEDVMAIHTQGLAEGIRCAMCTNSLKSDRGCDGGCVVNEDMYREVMNTIKNHIIPPTNPKMEQVEDCISRQAAIDAFERFIHELGIKDEPYNYGEMALSPQNVLAWKPLPESFKES